MKRFVLGFSVITGSLLVSLPASADRKLDELIATCKRHASDPQTKPFKTNVYCRGSYTYWEQQGTSDYQMATSYHVYNRATMKGERYHLDERGYQMPSDPNNGQCNIYREMRVDVPSIQVTMSTCQDLEAMAEEGRDQFCNRILEGAPGEDPVPTGTVVNTCNDNSNGGGNTGGGGGNLDNFGADLSFTSFNHQSKTFQGVKIDKVLDPRAILGNFGLRQGDIVVAIDGHSVTSTISFKSNIQSAISMNKNFEIIVFQERTKLLVAYRVN